MDANTLTTFDVKYAKRQEQESRLLQQIGHVEFNKWKQKDTAFKLRMSKWNNLGGQSSLTPEIQAIADEMRQRILANTVPHPSNPFALLGIAPGATKQIIRKAYRRKAKQMHPDIGGDVTVMKRLNAAYHLLMH